MTEKPHKTDLKEVKVQKCLQENVIFLSRVWEMCIWRRGVQRFIQNCWITNCKKLFLLRINLWDRKDRKTLIHYYPPKKSCFVCLFIHTTNMHYSYDVYFTYSIHTLYIIEKADWQRHKVQSESQVRDKRAIQTIKYHICRCIMYI